MFPNTTTYMIASVNHFNTVHLSKVKRQFRYIISNVSVLCVLIRSRSSGALMVEV
jgi:hypothetical protein